jgi:hypothetical protein
MPKEVATAPESDHLCAMVLTRHKRITAEFVGACPHGITFSASQTVTPDASPGTFLNNCTISIAVTENPVQAPFAIGFMVIGNCVFIRLLFRCTDLSSIS